MTDTATLAPTDALTQALRLLTHFDVNRYLMSNAHGRCNGAEKAQRHELLCCIYVAVFFGESQGEARRNHEDAYQAIHSATQELTDNLDAVIGFPLDSRPDYDMLVPKFFAEFHRLAMQALAKWGAPAPASGAGVRKGFVCVACECVYADAPVSQCDCCPERDEFYEVTISRTAPPAQPALRTAAQAIVARWDTPHWKDAEHTGAFIQRLREALAAPPAQEARVPLTDSLAAEVVYSMGWELDDDEKDDMVRVVRATEGAHGITAAQKETP